MALTCKELSFIEDMMGLEQVMIAKYKAAEANTQDEALRCKMKNAADRHQQHFEKLMGHLN
ncbi:MAG: spore coat protein [Clostridia bacterium]|nr:spore coat protein [Clostridia bacterium]